MEKCYSYNILMSITFKVLVTMTCEGFQNFTIGFKLLIFTTIKVLVYIKNLFTCDPRSLISRASLRTHRNVPSIDMNELTLMAVSTIALLVRMTASPR